MKLRIGIAALAIAFAGPALATAQEDYQTDIYSVDLETGATTLVTSIDGVGAAGMAVSDDGVVYLVTEDNALVTVTLDPEATPEAESPLTTDDSIEITGLANDEELIGLDVRPATGDLYAISEGGTIYVIDVDTGEATAPGDVIDPALEDDALGFDFDPTVDRIRVDVSTGQNLRLNPDTGAVGTNPDTMEPTIDGTISYADDDENAANTPAVVGAGYTNSVDGAEETQLYVIDAKQDVLALQDPPNDGTLNTVGPLDVDANAWSAFDITPDGVALLTVSEDDDDFTQGDD